MEEAEPARGRGTGCSELGKGRERGCSGCPGRGPSASWFARLALLTLEGRGHEAKDGGKAACHVVPGGSILPPSAIVSYGCQLGPYWFSVRVTRVTL